MRPLTEISVRGGIPRQLRRAEILGVVLVLSGTHHTWKADGNTPERRQRLHCTVNVRTSQWPRPTVECLFIWR